ncbi:MAG: hypothetical protein B7Z37_19330 [Verrucomicrobia bacterium 12-59-8]|nr:MAG: hypothetical protein B7Z37_19330 [Verrucomicrobia bacterium 12-59-8]
MKSHPLILLAAVLACYGLAAAQSGIPRALEYQPKAREASTVHDGIVFYRGQTYLIRHSRAARVDVTLVPKGQVLTSEGRLVALPTGFVRDTTTTVREGLCTIRGQAYLIRHGRMQRVNAVLVPDGQVLTAEGQLVPLPLDFSGFVRDRAPDGTALLAPLVQAGPQMPSRQAPQVIPRSTKPRFMPISLELPQVVAAPIAEEVRSPLPLPTSLLPPAPPSTKIP